MHIRDTGHILTFGDSSIEDKLSVRLRPILEGQHALMVTNRREAIIERDLHDRLALAVTWVDSGRPRRLQAARSTILMAGCDLVLVATGFVGHNVDMLLKPVCKHCRVPFLAASRGRLLAYLTAMADCFLVDPVADEIEEA